MEGQGLSLKGYDDAHGYSAQREISDRVGDGLEGPRTELQLASFVTRNLGPLDDGDRARESFAGRRVVNVAKLVAAHMTSNRPAP